MRPATAGLSPGKLRRSGSRPCAVAGVGRDEPLAERGGDVGGRRALARPAPAARPTRRARPASSVVAGNRSTCAGSSASGTQNCDTCSGKRIPSVASGLGGRALDRRPRLRHEGADLGQTVEAVADRVVAQVADAADAGEADRAGALQARLERGPQHVAVDGLAPPDLRERVDLGVRERRTGQRRVLGRVLEQAVAAFDHDGAVGVGDDRPDPEAAGPERRPGQLQGPPEGGLEVLPVGSHRPAP